MDEFAFIEKLKKKIPVSKRAVLGIGDDAAVLKKLGSGHLVVSTDMLVENVDFVLQGADKKNAVIPAKAGIQKNGFPIKTFGNDKLESLSPEKIGRKALAVNLSDLAAMGAEPSAFVLSIGKPKYISTRWLERFYDGLLEVAKQYKVDCIGGDFSGAKEFSVSVTIFGKAKRPVTRSGAKAGDRIGVTGTLGGSILRHHHDFQPRVREGLFLSQSRLANAMIDISDGLYQDLQHILRASRVGAELDLERIPVSEDARKIARAVILRTCARFRRKATGTKNLRPGSSAFFKVQDDGTLRSALTDGEDFELLFTASPSFKQRIEEVWKRKFPNVPLSWIGKIIKGRPEIKFFSGGKRVQLTNLSKKGFQHF